MKSEPTINLRKYIFIWLNSMVICSLPWFSSAHSRKIIKTHDKITLCKYNHVTSLCMYRFCSSSLFPGNLMNQSIPFSRFMMIMLTPFIIIISTTPSPSSSSFFPYFSTHHHHHHRLFSVIMIRLWFYYELFVKLFPF